MLDVRETYVYTIYKLLGTNDRTKDDLDDIARETRENTKIIYKGIINTSTRSFPRTERDKL